MFRGIHYSMPMLSIFSFQNKSGYTIRDLNYISKIIQDYLKTKNERAMSTVKTITTLTEKSEHNLSLSHEILSDNTFCRKLISERNSISCLVHSALPSSLMHYVFQFAPPTDIIVTSYPFFFIFKLATCSKLGDREYRAELGVHYKSHQQEEVKERKDKGAPATDYSM